LFRSGSNCFHGESLIPKKFAENDRVKDQTAIESPASVASFTHAAKHALILSVSEMEKQL
jgi:hypothetical protein